MSTHTPEVTIWVCEPCNVEIASQGKPDETCCLCGRADWVDTGRAPNCPTEADERIRAAAPDLLEALEYMVGSFEDVRDGGPQFIFEKHALAKARDAIAKARGETT